MSFNYSCLYLPPTTPCHPSHPHLPSLLPPQPGFVHVSFIVVPENPFPSPPLSLPNSQVPASFLCMWMSNSTNAICFGDCPFPSKRTWHSWWRSFDHIHVDFSWALYCAPLAYSSAFMSVKYCFDYCNFVVCVEVKKCKSSNFVSLFQICFGLLWGSLNILYDYGISLYFYKKKPLGLGRNAFNL